MSAWGPGSLGNSVPAGLDTQPMEYGGMRVDPANHYLVWDSIQKVAESKGFKCMRTGKKINPSIADERLVEIMGDKVKDLGEKADCPEYMVEEVTALYRYYTGGSVETFGEYLKSSSLFGSDDQQKACLQLAPMTSAWQAKKGLTPADVLTLKVEDAVNNACKECSLLSEEFCTICKNTEPNQGANLVSCVGYDDLPSVSSTVGLAEAEAVTGTGQFNCNPAEGSIENCSYLYFWKQGTQTWVQDLMYASGKEAVGPVFLKKLTGLTIGDLDVNKLAAQQASKTKNSSSNDPSLPPTNKDLVALSFEDGSFAKAKAVYITTLAADLIEIDGLTEWQKVYDAFLPFGATKLFMHWTDGLPAKIIESTQDGKVRIMLDGDRPGWLSRQVFYWDANTILIYQTAPEINDLPATQMYQMAQTEGMTAVIDKVLEELSEAHGETIPAPSWARVKGWPAGSLSYYKSQNGPIGGTALGFSSKIQRPLGQDYPVFYGSCSANGNGGNGWIQGSLEFVELHWEALKSVLAP